MTAQKKKPDFLFHPLVWAGLCFTIGVWNFFLWRSTHSDVHFTATIILLFCVWVNLDAWSKMR